MGYVDGLSSLLAVKRDEIGSAFSAHTFAQLHIFNLDTELICCFMSPLPEFGLDYFGCLDTLVPSSSASDYTLTC